MAVRNFLGKIKASEVLPAAIGAVGVVYSALQAHAPSPGSSSYVKKMGEWSKHVETGQLVATLALAAGMLAARIKKKSAR